MAEKSRHPENEKRFQDEIKSTFFVIFKGLSVAKDCVTTESTKSTPLFNVNLD